LKPGSEVQALRQVLGHNETTVAILPNFEDVSARFGLGVAQELSQQRRQIRLMGRIPFWPELVQQDAPAGGDLLRAEASHFAITQSLENLVFALEAHSQASFRDFPHIITKRI
jgi:hypothetical protein